MTEKLLEIKDLETHIYSHGDVITPVRGLSYDVNKGEVLGIVGESGSGKSVSVKSIMRLFDEDGFIRYRGEVILDDRNILAMDRNSFKDVIKKEISMVFQDPFESLNPLFTIEYQLVEAIESCGKWKDKDHVEVAKNLLVRCGIKNSETCLKSFPHQLSGGMRQRIMIAMAIAKLPKLLIADEPTTALDVTIQAEILKLFLELRKENDMSLLFITHDLSVVRDISDRILVMYLGEAVEIGDKEGIFERPLHPYTLGLISSIPSIDSERKSKLKTIGGFAKNLKELSCACNFYNRCERRQDICLEKHPALRKVGESLVRCHFPGGGR